MRESHPLLLALGAVLATVGGGIVAVFVGAQAVADGTFHLWNRAWFLIGFGVMVLGLLVLGGVLVDYSVRVRRGEGSWRQLWQRARRLQSPLGWRGFKRREATQGWVSPDALAKIAADPPESEPKEPTPSWEGMNHIRIARYEETRGLFLVHEWWTPSQEPGQVADVTIRLQQHRDGPLSRGEIRAVEYTLGPQFTDHSLVRMDPTDGYAIHVPMWGPMLCLAKVYFIDGTPPLLLERYVNFEDDAHADTAREIVSELPAASMAIYLPDAPCTLHPLEVEGVALGREGRYCHLAVASVSGQSVLECRVSLIRVARAQNNTYVDDDRFTRPLRLKWAGEDPTDPKAESAEIAADFPRLVDVAYSDDENPGMAFLMILDQAVGVPKTLGPGSYRLTARASASGSPGFDYTFLMNVGSGPVGVILSNYFGPPIPPLAIPTVHQGVVGGTTPRHGAPSGPPSP